MNDDEIQEAVTVFLVRLARRARDGADFGRLLLRVAGLVSAFYVEYTRERKTLGVRWFNTSQRKHP